MKKITTVTIGIPAFNEANNIENILKDIVSQETRSFKLEKVIVICDGSTDDTPTLVKKFIKKYSFVDLIDDKKRLGKSERLNELYKISKSDIFITFDADVKLGGKFIIKEIVKQFSDSKVGLVGGANLPLKPRKLFEKLVVPWLEVWYEVRKELNGGITIHNHPGCISAMKRDVYKKIFIPKFILADDDFIYFSVLKMGYRFSYAKNAKVYFRSASNAHDFFRQHARFISLKKTIADYFGDWVYEHYKVPQSRKIKSLIKVFIKKPFFLIASVLLQILLLLFNRFNKENYSKGIWVTAQSSKITI